MAKASEAWGIINRLFYSGATIEAWKVTNPDGTPIGSSGGGSLNALYVSTATTYSSGATGTLWIDANGNLKVTMATTIAGEDITNDVLKTEARYTNAFTSLASITTVKSGSGFWHNITFGHASCPSLIVYDQTSAANPIIQTFQAGMPPGTYQINRSFSTGLTLQFAVGISPQVSVGYR